MTNYGLSRHISSILPLIHFAFHLHHRTDSHRLFGDCLATYHWSTCIDPVPAQYLSPLPPSLNLPCIYVIGIRLRNVGISALFSCLLHLTGGGYLQPKVSNLTYFEMHSGLTC